MDSVSANIQGRPGLCFQDGKAIVRLWAPDTTTCELLVSDTQERLAMVRQEQGYWTLETSKIKPGDRYYFMLDKDQVLPDPASLAQPEGVHGPSQALDIDSYPWTDETWINPELGGYIIYELHTGAFSEAGTFEGILSRLDHLKKLGVNAIELMPVAQFPGRRNWGYDGVFPYCVQNSYGGAAALQDFVNQCHGHGFAVILDVVYNHIGPEGNCLNKFGPYFTEKYKTPWGKAINFDDAGSDAVRHYFVQNAMMWLRDFHIDALRLDAVHAIWDFSPVHMIREIATAIATYNASVSSRRYLILETDLNDSRYIRPVAESGYGADAQWCDDFHHALRVAAGQQRTGYYADFNGLSDLARSLKQAYVYTGQYSSGRKRRQGTSTAGLSGDHFVVYSQNHDQVGNRMLGERLSQLAGIKMQKLVAALVLTAPFIPMLFMGEEWGATSPFLYFTDHSDAGLVAAVEEGRKREFAGFQHRGKPLPANDPETYNQSKLPWHEVSLEPHTLLLRYYQRLVQLRKTAPALQNTDLDSVQTYLDAKSDVLIMERSYKEQTIYGLFNFSPSAHEVMLSPEVFPLHILLASSDTCWGGKGNAQLYYDHGSRITLLPESAILLTNYYVSS